MENELIKPNKVCETQYREQKNGASTSRCAREQIKVNPNKPTFHFSISS